MKSFWRYLSDTCLGVGAPSCIGFGGYNLISGAHTSAKTYLVFNLGVLMVCVLLAAIYYQRSRDSKN